MQRHAFTLLELIIVIAVITVLSSLLLPLITGAKQKAYDALTISRLNAFLVDIRKIESENGNLALTIQERANLGGPLYFGPLYEAIHTAKKNGGARPANVGGRNTWVKHPIFGSSIDPRLTDQIRENTTEVTPLNQAGHPSSKEWYTTEWPNTWPQTNWMSKPTNAIAPIIPYPWGSTGIRANGGPCEPDVDPDAIIAEIHAVNVDNFKYWLNARQSRNRWLAAESVNGPIWTWTATKGPHVKDNTILEVENFSYSRSDDPGTKRGDIEANEKFPFDLGYCSPLRTIELLQAANILPRGEKGRNAYRSDRDPEKPWNDAWGNPLIVVYAIYQAPRASVQSYQYQPGRDWFLKTSEVLYNHSRAVYISIGSLGPNGVDVIPPTWSQSNDVDVLVDAWNYIRILCQAHTWTEQSWSKPQWDTIRRSDESEGGDYGFLASPVQIK